MQREHHRLVATFIVTGLILAGCGRGVGGGGADTRAQVLGDTVTQDAGDLEAFCLTSRALRNVLLIQPFDEDALGSLLDTYVNSAPPEIRNQVAAVVTVFVFPPGKPTVHEDVETIRAFKATNCSPTLP
jgi:hypothetical protein